MENLEEKLLEYGSKKEGLSDLQDLVAETDEKELVNLVTTRLNSSKFTDIWSYMLQSFTETSNCHKKRFKIFLALLKELQERDVISSHTSMLLVQRTCIELIKFKTEHLVELCNFSLKYIQSDKCNSNKSFTWKDLLPDTIRILSERDVVTFNELDYSGLEFKTNFINTLCMTNWPPDIITSLTAMFIDMPLNKEEHLKVVNKLASYIEKLTPQEVPPFVYQLLRLSRHQNSRAVFLKLQQYFGLRIYSNTSFIRNNSSDESPELYAIENAEDHDVLDAESTVLYHIDNAASIGYNSIKEYLNSLKHITKSPEMFLNPFQLLTLLGVSTVEHYRETVFDLIRHSIVRSYNEEQKRSSSYWYREMVTSNFKPEEIFQQIMNLGDRGSVLEALSNFGFALLSIGAGLGRDIIAEKQWHLGTMILLKIIKKNRDVASDILKKFCHHILSRQSASQYIECLYILSKNQPLLMIENNSCVVELIENLVQIPGHVAIQLLDALIPLTKVSPTIRDQFILILRKSLISRSIETRQMAVSGFIKLIMTLKMSGLGVLSQNSSGSFSSGHSLYTQISLNRTTQTVGTSNFSNEAICWEILGILRRCFMQQAEVRSKLYEDLFDAVCVNSELCIPILEVLWFHFVEYYVINEESVPPLNFVKVTMLRDNDCILLEPLGKQIFAVSQIVAKATESEDDKDNPVVVKYVQILDSLCRRMSACELMHLELDDGTDLTDILPESQQKMFVLKEAISVYEALIGYKMITWKKDSENHGRNISSLHEAYARFLNFGRNLSKPKKGGKLDRKTTNTQKNTSKASQSLKKIDQSSKSLKVVFKPPDFILDFATVDKGLKTLLETSVDWATANDVNVIRTKAEIHIFFLRGAINLVGKMKNHKPIDGLFQKKFFDYMTSIASSIYNRIITRLNDYIDFDCLAAMEGLECFQNILSVIKYQFGTNILSFLSKVGGLDKDSELINHLKPIIEHYQKVFESEEDEYSNDPEIKKMSLIIINTLSILCSFIPNESSVLSIQIYDCLKMYAYHNAVPSKVSGAFMNLLLELHLRYKMGLALFESVSYTLKSDLPRDQEETVEEQEEEKLKIVTLSTANSIILSLCSNIKTILDEVDSIIARIKSDYYILTSPGEDHLDRKRENLKSKEKGVACQLCFVANILTNLLRTEIQPGNVSDAVFKNIVQFYSLLSTLSKYFLGRSTKNNLAFQGAWFERLVKLSGKKLAPVVYQFITYIGENKKNCEVHTQGAKKKPMEASTMKLKVLRETKIIPKVIYEIEQFSKNVIHLTKKTKYDLSKYVGQGTVRDFRLSELKKVLERAGGGGAETQQTQNEESEAIRDYVAETRSTHGSESDEENDDSNSPPPTKKSRRKS